MIDLDERLKKAFDPNSSGRALKDKHLSSSGAGLVSSGIIPEAHNLFTLADRDRNGTLDFQEVEAIRQLLLVIAPEDYPNPIDPSFADKVMGSAIDEDGSGDIDRVEWINFVTRQANVHGERPMLRLLQLLKKELNKQWR